MRTLVPAILGFALGCRPAAPTDAPAGRAATPPTAGTDAAADAATAGPATASTTDASVEAMNAEAIVCVLGDRRVGQYVHAELPERLPVKLHVAPAVAIATAPVLFGAPAELVGTADALVDVHEIVRVGTSATVKLSIPREGVIAEVECIREGDHWHTGRAEVAER